MLPQGPNYDLIKLQQDLTMIDNIGTGLSNTYIANGCQPSSVLELLAGNLFRLNQPKQCHFLACQLFRILTYQEFTDCHHQLWLKYAELAEARLNQLQTVLGSEYTIEHWRVLASLAEASDKLNFSHFESKVDLLTTFHTVAVATAAAMEKYDVFWFHPQLAKIAKNLTIAKATALSQPDHSNQD